MREFPNYCDLIRVEMRFPTHSSAIAEIWLHISVIGYFKQLTQEEVQELQKFITERAEELWHGPISENSCFLSADKKYGLLSWNCPGNACGYDLTGEQREHAEKEDADWVSFQPHNVDSSMQLNFLLAAAYYFCRKAQGKSSADSSRP